MRRFPGDRADYTPRSVSRLFRLHAGGLDDRRDAGHLALDQLLQSGRSAVGALRGGTAEFRIALLDGRIVERLAQRGRQLVDNLLRYTFRSDHGVPRSE